MQEIFLNFHAINIHKQLLTCKFYMALSKDNSFDTNLITNYHCLALFAFLDYLNSNPKMYVIIIVEGLLLAHGTHFDWYGPQPYLVGSA